MNNRRNDLLSLMKEFVLGRGHQIGRLILGLVGCWSCLDVWGQRFSDIERYGAEMNSAQAELLEQGLAKKSDDESARLQLYGYYGRYREIAGAFERRMEHAIWLIEHSPRCGLHRSSYAFFDREQHPEFFKRGKELWLAHIDRNPSDLAIMEYAGLFLRESDLEIAEALFQRGYQAQPDEPRWPNNLGRLRLRAMKKADPGSEQRARSAAEALDFFQQTYRLSVEHGKGMLLPSLCQVALASGRFSEAERYARSMLLQEGAGSFGYQRNHYHGHTVMGVLKFDRGEYDEAKHLLMKSIDLPPSVSEMSNEPDLSLVRRFIDKGDKAVAMAFFTACESIWKSGQDQLEEWQAKLERGQTIDFEHSPMY